MRRRYHLHLPGLAYIGLIFLVAVAAMNGQNNLLFWILGLMVSAMLISGIVSGLMMRRLRVQRIVPAHGVVGEPLVVRYALSNRSRYLSIFNMHIEECAAADPKGFGRLMAPARAWVMHIGPRETVHGEAVLWPSRRGEARFETLRIWTTFPFGIIKKSISIAQPQHILIYPLLYEVNRRVVDCIGPQGLTGAKISRRPPDPAGSDDYFGMRDYRPGDSMRHIAWKRTAMLDQLVSIERTRPAPPRLRVIVNLTTPTHRLRVDADGPHSPRQLEELSISIAASIIHAASHKGFEVGLSLPGTGQPSIPIKHGHWHHLKMMGALASIDLDATRQKPERQRARDSERAGQIVIHPDRAEPAVGGPNAIHLTARQLESLVVRPIGWDPNERVDPKHTGQPTEQAA